MREEYTVWLMRVQIQYCIFFLHRTAVFQLLVFFCSAIDCFRQLFTRLTADFDPALKEIAKILAQRWHDVPQERKQVGRPSPS